MLALFCASSFFTACHKEEIEKEEKHEKQNSSNTTSDKIVDEENNNKSNSNTISYKYNEIKATWDSENATDSYGAIDVESQSLCGINDSERDFIVWYNQSDGIMLMSPDGKWLSSQFSNYATSKKYTKFVNLGPLKLSKSNYQTFLSNYAGKTILTSDLLSDSYGGAKGSKAELGDAVFFETYDGVKGVFVLENVYAKTATYSLYVILGAKNDNSGGSLSGKTIKDPDITDSYNYFNKTVTIKITNDENSNITIGALNGNNNCNLNDAERDIIRIYVKADANLLLISPDDNFLTTLKGYALSNKKTKFVNLGVINITESNYQTILQNYAQKYISKSDILPWQYNYATGTITKLNDAVFFETADGEKGIIVLEKCYSTSYQISIYTISGAENDKKSEIKSSQKFGTVTIKNTSSNPYKLFIDDVLAVTMSGNTSYTYKLSCDVKHKLYVEQQSGYLFYATTGTTYVTFSNDGETKTLTGPQSNDSYF